MLCRSVSISITNNTPPNATYWALLSSGIEWQGAWSAGTYTKAQAVSHEGNSWICNTTSTTEEPTGTPTDWDKLSQKGDTGSTGATGATGTDGAESFTYIGYASDASGTDFTLTFSSSLDYIAILTTATEIPSPVVGDFAGLWKNYKGVTGDAGPDGAESFTYIGYASDDTGTDYGLEIKPSTEAIEGWAWGGNPSDATISGVVGWISFNSANLEISGGAAYAVVADCFELMKSCVRIQTVSIIKDYSGVFLKITDRQTNACDHRKQDQVRLENSDQLKTGNRSAVNSPGSQQAE